MQWWRFFLHHSTSSFQLLLLLLIVQAFSLLVIMATAFPVDGSVMETTIAEIEAMNHLVADVSWKLANYYPVIMPRNSLCPGTLICVPRNNLCPGTINDQEFHRVFSRSQPDLRFSLSIFFLTQEVLLVWWASLCTIAFLFGCHRICLLSLVQFCNPLKMKCKDF